jgi:hypothetical protein
MNKLIPVLLLFSAVQIPAFAQPEYKPITFFYRPSVGAMFATRSFSSNHIPDNLIETKFQNLFCQPLSVGFFYRNIGIEGHLALSPVQNPQTRNSRFLKDIHLQYGDRYYTTISSSVTYDYSGDSSDPLTRGSIGPSYKIEKNRLIFVGRMMVGAVSTGELHLIWIWIRGSTRPMSPMLKASQTLSPGMWPPGNTDTIIS